MTLALRRLVVVLRSGGKKKLPELTPGHSSQLDSFVAVRTS